MMTRIEDMVLRTAEQGHDGQWRFENKTAAEWRARGETLRKIGTPDAHAAANETRRIAQRLRELDRTIAEKAISDLDQVLDLFTRLGFPVAEQARDDLTEDLPVPVSAQKEILLNTGWSLWFTAAGVYLGSYYDALGQAAWDEDEPRWQPRGYELGKQGEHTTTQDNDSHRTP